MGKGYNNYMCKKPFHPGSKANIKRAWMAEQKTENEKKKQEDLRTQYEKEQDLYNNKAMISSESKDKLQLNFMYEAPPGAKRERQKEDDEPEYKFEWQRKYNAPREDYARGNEDIKDQPFGIPVRNVRCIKCHKWGHINTDRECPLFMQASASSMPSTSMDPMELMRQMREDGYGLKENVLGHQMNPNAANQQFIASEESDPETEFLKSLSTSDKKKLLRKLKKLSKKQEKIKKKKSKKSKKSKLKEFSESDSDIEKETKKKKKKSKHKKFSSSSSEFSSDEITDEREINNKKNRHGSPSKSEKKKHETKKKKHDEDDYKLNPSETNGKKKHHVDNELDSSETKKKKQHREDNEVDSSETKKKKKHKEEDYELYPCEKKKKMHSEENYELDPSREKKKKKHHEENYEVDPSREKKKKHNEDGYKLKSSKDQENVRRNKESDKYKKKEEFSGNERQSTKSLSDSEKVSDIDYVKKVKDGEKKAKNEVPSTGRGHSIKILSKEYTEKDYVKKVKDNYKKAEYEESNQTKKSSDKEPTQTNENMVQSNWKSSYSSSSSDSEDAGSGMGTSTSSKRKVQELSPSAKKVKVEKPDSVVMESKASGSKPVHPDGFTHSFPQTKVTYDYLVAEEEYKGKIHDEFRHHFREDRSPSVKQKYNN